LVKIEKIEDISGKIVINIMPFDLVATIPIGIVVALAVKQMHTMIVDWLNHPTILVTKVFENIANKTLALRNNVADVAVFAFAGAIDIVNSVKGLILHIVGGAIQEVIRVLHLLVHIVKQGVLVIKNVYTIILAGLETFYLALKSINDFGWYIAEGGALVVNTMVTAPGRFYAYANTTITVFIKEQVLPTVDWFLYGPTISNTRYYMLLLLFIVVFSLWNYYGTYKKKKNSIKQEKSA